MFRLRCQECRPMHLTDIDNIAKYCIDFESVALVSYLQKNTVLTKLSALQEVLALKTQIKGMSSSHV